jgi:hypothetical protein
VRRCPGLEEGRAVALPPEKLGTTGLPRTTPIHADRVSTYAAATNDPNRAYEGAGVHVFEAPGRRAVVVTNGLAEVV